MRRVGTPFYLALRQKALPRQTQPAMNVNPPAGVIAPIQRGAPSASAYRLPQNSITPIVNAIELAMRQRDGGAPASPRSANACQNW